MLFCIHFLQILQQCGVFRPHLHYYLCRKRSGTEWMVIMKSQLIVTAPPITTFPAYADTLAIICSFDEGREWMFSHYIQIQVNDIVSRVNDPDDFMLLAMFTSSFFVDIDMRKQANVACDNFFLGGERCPFLNVYEIPNSYVDAIDDSFINFIKRTIDNKIYIFLYVEISKIPNYGIKSELSHQVLIFGYDDDEQTVDFADFILGKYTFTKCTYDEMENAYKNVEKVLLPIVKTTALVQHIGYGAFTFDYSYIQDSIRAYLYPDIKVTERQNNYTMSIFKPVNWQTETYMGVDVYDYFPKFVARELELGKAIIDHRLFHAMYDHKEMMVKRIEFLIQQKCISKDKYSFLEEYSSNVCNRMRVIRNLVLKYNEKDNPKTLDKINIMLAETKTTETDLLKQIFDV